MIWTLEEEERDREMETDPGTNTMAQVARMAGDVLKCLKFTYDTPSMNQSRKMPVLDTQIWMEKETREAGIPGDMFKDRELINTKTGSLRRVIVYMFYQKPMAQRVYNLYRSAYPEN